MTGPRHLTWNNFLATVFVHGQQRTHRVSESPRIEVFGDGVSNRVGMLLEIVAGASLPPELSKLAFISTRTFSDGESTFLEVATSHASLHRQFYHFAAAVAEGVIVEQRPAIDAVRRELTCFTDLLAEKLLLSIERQIGLLGELLFLERLILRSGSDALDSWIGPTGEPHDFRIKMHEYEVKTTVSPRRVHTIHGTEQLVASAGCSLYLVSVLLGPAGGDDGFSLASTVSALANRFESLPARAAQFAKALDDSDFRTTESQHYSRRFTLRRPIAIATVDSTFPAVTRPTLQQMLGPLATRVDSVQYDVSVEGLEREDGTAEFETALAHWLHSTALI